MKKIIENTVKSSLTIIQYMKTNLKISFYKFKLCHKQLKKTNILGRNDSSTVK